MRKLQPQNLKETLTLLSAAARAKAVHNDIYPAPPGSASHA
jgi:hypothetical protein